MRKLFVCGVLAAFAALAGCGGGAGDAPKLVPATGTVHYREQPVSGATVTFMVDGKPIATGTTNAEGKFTMTTNGRAGAPLGEAKVGITKLAEGAVPTEAMKPEDLAKMGAEAMTKGRGAAPVGPRSEIPLKYGNPTSSSLVAPLTTDSSKNVFAFKLVD